MNHEISPPPAKRRKISTNNVKTGRISTAPPAAAPDAASLRGFIRRHHWPAFLFLQEVKIAAKDVKTQDAVRSAVNARLPTETSNTTTGPSYEAHFTLPCDSHNARGPRGSGKVYGVCSIVRADVFKDFAVKVRTVDWDSEGRVSVVELVGPSAKLALFNIYAVNGTDNACRDPATGAVCGTRHDRKLSFHRLLAEECLSLEEKGWEILLAGDMNVAPARIDGHPQLRTFPQQHVVNRADFNARFLGGKRRDEGKVFDGVDVWRRMNEGEKRFTWFPRGREWGSSCDRVDYVVVGKSMWDRGMRGPSDHVPVWVDVRLPDKDEREKDEES
ncbi:DNase I-like protein [Karstenula rhodostoma CBS 690.94]|uniref:DNase I-like protein n=1 Tax=Karstenula rhodostoma CBS 690.94 TaxID=1392251 RepID=A0A9P4P9X7_9PLEO|nr:DNase I-like protein [Karstenula rhodostoma CBS 690.94]